MLNNIVLFVKRLMPTISKSDAETDLETTLEELKSVVSPLMVRVAEATADTRTQPQSKWSKGLIAEFYKELDPKENKMSLPATKSISRDINHIVTRNLIPNTELILKLFSSKLPSTASKRNISLTQATLLRSVSHVYFISRYTLAFMNCMLAKEYERSKMEVREEYNPSPKELQFVEKNMWIYARLLNFYGRDPKYFTSSTNSLNDVLIDPEKVERDVAVTMTELADPIPTIPSGFSGSPIYASRLIFAEWQASRYRKMREEKQLIESRILHYQMALNEKESDPVIEKEIEHLQGIVTGLQRSITKYEESIE